MELAEKVKGRNVAAQIGEEGNWEDESDEEMEADEALQLRPESQRRGLYTYCNVNVSITSVPWIIEHLL